MPPENHTNKPVTQESSLSERFPGLETLSVDPENAQIQSRTALESYLTSREEHYIRNHHRTPDIDASEWTVSLTGMVDEVVSSRYLRSNTTIRLNPWFT